MANSKSEFYDIIVIGGGPAGVGGGIYAARKQLKTLLVTESFGGQSLVSSDIQNWIGTTHVSGYDFAKMLEMHVRAQESITIVENDLVVAVAPIDEGFELKTKQGNTYQTKTVLVTSGSRRRRLGVPGEDKFDGKGVAFCSICDAPLFKDKVVAVVGGGNAGLEAAIDLFAYASKVYLLERNAALRGDPVTQEIVLKNPKLETIFNVTTEEIYGDKFVMGLRYKNLTSGAVADLKLDGVFVEIGALPNSEFLGDLVQLNQFKEVIVDPVTQRTSRSGIWAAGDVTDVRYKQNNIAVGDAIKAVLDMYEQVSKKAI